MAIRVVEWRLSSSAARHYDKEKTMAKLQLILMAILAVCGRLFALPTSAARRGGFNLLRAFSVMRRSLPNCRFLVLCLLGATLAVSGCGGSTYTVVYDDVLKENCGYLRSANTCKKAKDYARCLADESSAVVHGAVYDSYQARYYFPALRNVKIECGEEDAEKGSPYQQVCPEGAACNQGVQ
ncbi:MAG: hypothetical protein ACR2P4_06075 [Gammaproteobacteria bacterium]